MIFVLTLGLSLHEAHAIVYTATRSGDWDDVHAWVGGLKPTGIVGKGNLVIIPAGIIITTFNTYGSGVAVTVSGTVNVYGSWSNTGGVVITQNGTLNNNGTFENYFGNLQNSGTINNNGTLSDSYSGFTSNAGTIYNKGIIGRAFFISGLSNSGVIINDGYFDFAHSDNSQSGKIINNQVLDISTQLPAANDGTLDNHGKFLIKGPLTNNGKIKNFDGAVIDNRDTITNNDIITNLCGGIIINSGTISVNPIQEESCFLKMMQVIQSLNNNGTINGGQSNSLIIKLEHGQDSENNNPNLACNELRSFTNEISALNNGKIISTQTYQNIISLANSTSIRIGC